MDVIIELNGSLPIAENQEIINAFLLEESHKQNKSRKTIIKYRKNLMSFFKDITVPIHLIQLDDIQNRITIKTVNYNSNTIRNYTSILRIFFRFCAEEGYIDQSPVEQLDRQKEISFNDWELQLTLPNNENQRIVNEYLLNMNNQNIKQLTIRKHRLGLTAFFKDWEKPFSLITLEEIERWLEEGKRKDKRQVISSLRSFYTFCEEKGYVVNPPVKKEKWLRTTDREWEIERPIKNAENLALIQRYLLSLKNKNKNKKTIEEYRIVLVCFFEDRVESFALITLAEIDQWIHERLQDRSKNTIERYLSVLRNFYRFCLNQGLIDESPVKFMWERENDGNRYWELKSPLLNAQNHKVINEYLLSLKLENLSEYTVRYRRWFLEIFFKNQKESFVQLSSEYFLKCIVEWKQTVQEQSMIHYLSILYTFYKFCVEEGYIETSPIKSRWIPSKPQSTPKYLEKEQVAKIRMQCEKHALRNLTIVEFLYATGCRIGELYRLNRADVDINNRTALVFGKGNKLRTVHFTERCALYLEKYLETREDTHSALFISNREMRLGINRMQRIIREIGIQANLEGSLHAHRFRHTFATELLAKGADFSFIADELGHSNLNTTKVYARIPKKNLIIMYRKFMG